MTLTQSEIKILEQLPLTEAMPAENTYACLEASAKAFPEKIALRFSPDLMQPEFSMALTYAQLFTKVNQTIQLWQDVGITKHDVVAICLPNCLEHYFASLAAEAIGIAFPVNPFLPEDQLNYLFEQTKPRVLVIPGQGMYLPLWEKFQKLRQQLPQETVSFSVEAPDDADHATASGSSSTSSTNFSNESGNASVEIFNFSAALSKYNQRVIDANDLHTLNDVCAYFCTSGTTGLVKTAKLTQQARLYMAWATSKGFSLKSNDVILLGLPLFHVGAAMLGGLASILTGSTVVLLSPAGWMDPTLSRKFSKLTEVFQGTVVVGLPTHFHAILADSQLSPTEMAEQLRSLRLLIAGNPLSLADAKRFFELLPPSAEICGLYGLTESTAIVTINPVAKDLSNLNAIGYPLPYQELRVLEGQDRDQSKFFTVCPVNKAGHLLLKGPNVMAGYIPACQPERFITYQNSIWFDTRDIVRCDAQGIFWFVSRSEEQIRISDAVVFNSLEVETVLNRHPEVLMSAVVGLPTQEGFEQPVAFIALTKGQVSEEMLSTWVSKQMPEVERRPVRIYLQTALSLNPMGKVDKVSLRCFALTEYWRAELAKLPAFSERAYQVTAVLKPPTGITLQFKTFAICPDEEPVFRDAIDSCMVGYRMPYEIECLSESVSS